ncbi:hypothetical protein [Candidatus Thiosymbion oneisti]|uniref:hypothetical protein n=1 Tax=Candidatus Thiosymbion oneisti TaxID=589554 RepID=UPI000B7E48D8|nr:hypothetical protein [Candidatus Thiosymbion oneisti]
MRIAGEPVENEVRSREGTVYITARHVYKIFGSGTNPYNVLGIYKIAEAKGVPVPNTAKFTARLQDGTHTRTIGGLRSTRASGRFFQLSKPGGEKILINEIEKVTNRELMETVIAGLRNASEHGVMDPQGFIDVNRNPPLTFIDLHSRGLPNPVAFEKVLEAAEVRLNELASTPSRSRMPGR